MVYHDDSLSRSFVLSDNSHRGEKRDRHMEGDANVSQHSSDQEALLLGEETASLFHRYGHALFAYVRLHETLTRRL